MPKVVHPNVIEIDFLSDPLPVREKAGQATTRLVDDGARDALDLLNVVERRQRRFGHPDGVSASLDRRCEGTIVCVPYAGDATEADLSSFFGGTKPFAPDIRVWTKKFEAGSWFPSTSRVARWRGSSSSWMKTAVWSKGPENNSLASYAFGSRAIRSWIWSGMRTAVTN